MYSEPKINRTFKAGKLSRPSSTVMMFKVKQMCLEPVCDYISGLIYISDVVDIAFQAINHCCFYNYQILWYS